MGGYFEGWYLKQQTTTGTVAFIPAVHREAEGGCTASLQVITDQGAWSLPARDWSYDSDRKRLCLDHSWFSPYGCRLDTEGQGLAVKGRLRYSGLTLPRYDIMGPFRYVPFMQCRHRVFSLYHRVNGWLEINGTLHRFRAAPGYMEGDRGTSFPRRYIWTQCSWREGCVMLSVADIPFLGGCFTGCIGAVYGNGIERRFATYLGARVIQADNRSAVIRQGGAVLTVRLLEDRAQPLLAPRSGGMTRLIRESVACRVLYDLQENGREILHFVTDRAGFEGAWETEPRPSQRQPIVLPNP